MSSPPVPVIGYVVKMFPRLSETFIRNEILEMERQAVPLRIFSLKRPAESAVPETSRTARAGGAESRAQEVRTKVVYLPERVYREPFRVLRAQGNVLRRYPRGYLRTLSHVLRGRLLRALPRGLRRFSQACCIVDEMGGGGHLHAHFASDPTRLASWARMICGISFSVSTHAKDLFQDSRISSPGLYFKLNAAKFVVANSHFSAASLLASRNGFSDAIPLKVVTIYNGVDLTTLTPRLNESSTPTILSVGRLVEKKGFRQLIQACGVLCKWGVPFQCEIIGSGPLKPALQEEIMQLELQEYVRLRGERPNAELIPFYRGALVFALPCVVAANGDRDILPNVLKEAMAVGVPVVTSRLDGIEELVIHGRTGLLVPPNDVGALAASLRKLLEDAPLRRHLSVEGRKIVEERFDARKNFRQLGELLTEAVK